MKPPSPPTHESPLGMARVVESIFGLSSRATTRKTGTWTGKTGSLTALHALRVACALFVSTSSSLGAGP